MPDQSAKVFVVPNCQDPAYILAQAKADPRELPQDKLNVVSVARLGKEKGILRAVEAITRLGELKSRLRYYVIGDGIQRNALLEAIRRQKLEHTVYWLGELKNPYGYLQAADLLLIPSVSEAAPMVIGEAAILGTPILSTQTCSADEMIQKPGIGLVCENSVEGLARGLTQILKAPRIRREWEAACVKSGYDNAAAVRRLIQMIEQE